MDEPDAPSWRVLTSVVAAIRDGTYAPGRWMPPQSELAQMHAVSRSTAAQVMFTLKVLGLVVTTPGGASRVSAEPARSMALDTLTLAEEARRVARTGGSAT